MRPENDEFPILLPLTLRVVCRLVDDVVRRDRSDAITFACCIDSVGQCQVALGSHTSGVNLEMKSVAGTCPSPVHVINIYLYLWSHQ
jgi:hypothetical protein